jgi:hypothetical protein
MKTDRRGPWVGTLTDPFRMNVSTLSTLSLVDLKQLAKGRRIKQYYIMKRHQLIQILSLPELPESFRREKLTIQELRDEAKRKGIRGFWSLHREDLLNLLHPLEETPA